MSDWIHGRQLLSPARRKIMRRCVRDAEEIAWLYWIPGTEERRSGQMLEHRRALATIVLAMLWSRHRYPPFKPLADFAQSILDGSEMSDGDYATEQSRMHKTVDLMRLDDRESVIRHIEEALARADPNARNPRADRIALTCRQAAESILEHAVAAPPLFEHRITLVDEPGER